MFKHSNYRPIDTISSTSSMGQVEQDRELSYSDENDTTNLSRIYHYETSEDMEEEKRDEDRPKCCPELNRSLIVYKAFYFLFFGAVGALFPYLAVFYKQLWLSPHQVGILIGLRPFIQMCASPLWGVLADTYNVSKWILLMSIGAWLASNYSISLVKPSQYDPGCSLNLTYLPMIEDIDDQDFNWPNIEPVVSKKDNISKPGMAANGLGRLNLIHNAPVGELNFDGEDFAQRGDFEGSSQAGLNVYPGDSKKTAEKDITTSLYGTRIGDKIALKTMRDKGEDSHVSRNVTFKSPIETKLNMDKKLNSKNKTGKIVKKEDIVRLLKIMFYRRTEQSYQSKQITKRHDKEAIAKSRNSFVNLREAKGERAVGSAASAGLLDTDRARRSAAKPVDDDGGQSDDGVTGEDQEAFLQDALNSSEGGEYYAESILPNQRVLAKEGLREEFDSLKAADGVFWPVLNRADPTNSSEVESGAQSVETRKIFNILLAITVCGTILSSPAATLSDTATLQALGDDKYRYGQQRLWGAFGWGIGAFIVGAIVSVTQEIKLCADPKHIDYVLSFYVYAVVMVLAFICAIFFKFDLVGETSYRESFWEAFTLFADCQHLCFILTLLCAGTAMGFTHTFLFWHLHDMGGTQFLFSIVAAVQCTSEVFMYFVSGYLILKLGCDSVLYIGLLANVLRLFAYSVITQPFYSVPLEVLQGISSASIWTASVCYVGLNEGVQVTLQAILHGIYWGLGHGGGGMLGGLVVSSLGSNATFIIFGICCVANLAILLIMKYWKKLFEFLSGYTSVETIPSGTYILVESQRAGKG